MSDFAEESFQCQVSFAETTTPDEPLTSPYGAIGALGALGGRTYRGVVSRVSPLPNPPAAAAGIYYLETDYDVAMADLDYNISISGVALIRVGDLLRVGSLTSPDGRVRGVYQLRVGAAGTGTPDDALGALVTVTMKRVDPNLHAPGT